MANDPPVPSLALGDVIHSMSPSPAPADTAAAATTASFSPPTHSQPPSDAERVCILKRLTEMGPFTQGTSNASSREKELVDMVLRLANDTPPDPSQLVLQAEAISSLTLQRDFLIRQAEEQRSRWESESEGWTRSAEALIAQRNKPRNQAIRDGSQERQCSSFESDNKALREKLAGTQSRLTSLESEVTKLRPLLVQAFAISPDPPYPTTPYNTSTPTHAKQKPARMRKKKEKEPPPLTTVDEQVTDYEIDELPDNPTTTSISPNNYSNHLNPNSQNQPRTEAPHYHSPVKRPKAAKGPLMSDARAEHLLLAARKIGRERVVNMARLRSTKGKVHESERMLDDESSSSPKTPKRPSTNPPPHSHSHYPFSLPHPHAHTQSQVHTPHALNPGFVFLNSPLGVPSSFPGSPVRPQYLLPLTGYSAVSTVTPRKDSVGESSGTITGTGTGTNPPTPLDSLLSAARSMMDDRPPPRSNGIGSITRDKNEKTRRASVIDIPESPVPPKRRKVVGGSTSASAGLVKRMPASMDSGPRPKSSGGAGDDVSSGIGISRVKSALDVLADQAAVFSSKEQGKGKEKKGEQRPKSVEAKETPSVRKARLRKGGEKEQIRNEKGKSWERERDKKTMDDMQDTERQAQVSAVPQGEPILVHSQRLEDVDQFGDGWEAVPSLGPVTRWCEGHEDNSRSIIEGRHGVPVTEVKLGVGVDKITAISKDKDKEQAIRGTLSAVDKSLRPFPLSPTHPDIQLQTDEVVTDLSTRQPGSSTHVLPAPILLERSRSEDRQAKPLIYNNFDFKPRRAVSIPPRTNCGEVSLDLDSKSKLLLQERGTDIELEKKTELGLHGVLSLDTGGSGSKTPRPPPELAEGVVGSETGSASRGVMRVDQDMQMATSGKRPRSPYVKWSKEEDDLLAQAVAKYGQKWDLVQKALPSRGYHQVRQRWLRKLGVFDSKPDLSSFQTGSLSSTSVNAGADQTADPPPNLKLGLAPLSSELAFSGLGRGVDSHAAGR